MRVYFSWTLIFQCKFHFFPRSPLNSTFDLIEENAQGRPEDNQVEIVSRHHKNINQPKKLAIPDIAIAGQLDYM